MADQGKFSKAEVCELYNVERWDNGYFSVNDKGHLCVLPEKREDGPKIDFMEVIEEIKDHNIPFPTVIRFHDILRSQVKLLNVLQNREIERVGGTESIPVDIRIISATHRNLEGMIETGQFREALWFRLNVFPLMIPPLRQRK